ncbi:MAG: PepSY domain-containing protein [Deltaproteobacteria bacterium]|nr:PepSY domain-containing protein [Deltaproteobacteria bacterium]
MKGLLGEKWRWITASALLIVLISVGAGSAGMPPPAALGQTGFQAPTSSCSIKVPEPEPMDLTTLAKISADKAMATALAACPGTRVIKVELANEDGCLVYEVLLSTGLEVKVDAGNGQVLRSASDM